MRKISLILQENFATIVKVDTNSLSLLLTGVYLQSSNSENYKTIYQNQIDTISGTLSHFEECCEFVVFGDFRSCPSKPSNKRSGQPNSLSPILDTFIEDQGIYPTDILYGSGPTFTYHHLTLPNHSYI